MFILNACGSPCFHPASANGRLVFGGRSSMTSGLITRQGIYSFLAGLLFYLGFWLLGSPYPALLALTGALACLVPVVGAAMAISAVLLVGLLTSVQLSLFTVFYTLVRLDCPGRLGQTTPFHPQVG